jgi:hypothetical protein
MTNKKFAVAGPRLAKMCKEANNIGEMRIGKTLGGRTDCHQLRKEHREGMLERDAAITFVMNTGKPATEILEKWACVDIYAGGVR